MKATGGRELTDNDIFNVSRKLNERFDIQKLASQLGLGEDDMKPFFNQYGMNFQAVAYKILHKWRKTQIDDFKAYTALCEALTHNVKLVRIAATIIGYKA